MVGHTSGPYAYIPVLNKRQLQNSIPKDCKSAIPIRESLESYTVTRSSSVLDLAGAHD